MIRLIGREPPASTLSRELVILVNLRDEREPKMAFPAPSFCCFMIMFETDSC